MKVKATTRFKIVGTEVVGMGAFLLFLALQEVREQASLGFRSFGWEYGVLGATLILVGLEILSLTRMLHGERSPLGGNR